MVLSNQKSSLQERFQFGHFKNHHLEIVITIQVKQRQVKKENKTMVAKYT